MSDYSNTFFTNLKQNMYSEQEVEQAATQAAEQGAMQGAQQAGRQIAQQAISPDNQSKMRQQFKQGVVGQLMNQGGQQQ